MSAYESAAENIKTIMEKRYLLSPDTAQAALDASPLKDLFEKHEDLASHTSNEAWAAEVYEYWKYLRKRAGH